MATLYKTTRSKYYYLNIYYEGRRYRYSTKTDDIKIAKRILKIREGELALKRFNIPTESEERMLLEEFIEKYLEYSKNNKALGTFEIEKYALNKVLEVLSNKQLKNITLIDCERYKIERSKSVAKTTVNIEIRSLKSVFEIAKRWSYVVQNPFKEVKQFKIPESNIPKYLTKEQIKELLDIIKDQEFKNLIIFYLNTGCRRNEALNLEWRDIDFKNKTITFLLTKSGSRRTIPINLSLLKILELMKVKNVSKNNDKKVFNFLPSYVTHKFRKYLNAIGFKENKSIHILRHTFASHLVMSGVDLYTVKKLLGHSDIKITEIYSHLAPDYLKNSVSKLNY